MVARADPSTRPEREVITLGNVGAVDTLLRLLLLFSRSSLCPKGYLQLSCRQCNAQAGRCWDLCGERDRDQSPCVVRYEWVRNSRGGIYHELMWRREPLGMNNPLYSRSPVVRWGWPRATGGLQRQTSFIIQRIYGIPARSFHSGILSPTALSIQSL